MMLLLLITLLFMGACQPLAETVGELSAAGDGKRVYLQMQLGDFRVKKARLTFTLDHDTMPAKLHALYYDGIEVSPLSLNGKELGLSRFIVFPHVVFSWRHKKKDGGIIYTCHLHDVSLGEQRDIIVKGSTTAQFCFEQQVGIGNEDERGGNYVQLLAEHCASISASRASRFVFLDGKDFACDVSEYRDGSVVLQASCLAHESAASCLDGKIRACAADNVGFPKFVEAFKALVDTQKCDKSEQCTFKYSLKASESGEQNNSQAAEGEQFCPALTGQAVAGTETETEAEAGATTETETETASEPEVKI